MSLAFWYLSVSSNVFFESFLLLSSYLKNEKLVSERKILSVFNNFRIFHHFCKKGERNINSAQRNFLNSFWEVLGKISIDKRLSLEIIVDNCCQVLGCLKRTA